MYSATIGTANPNRKSEVGDKKFILLTIKSGRRFRCQRRYEIDKKSSLGCEELLNNLETARTTDAAIQI